MMIDLGIIGSGDVVQVRHADILKELSKSVRVRCIVSSRQEAVDIIQERLGYPVLRVNTVDDAIKMGIKAALVAVPPAKTMDVANYLIKSKIALYVEKPLSEDVVTGAKFVEDVTKAKLPVVIGENFRNQKRFDVVNEICTECVDKPLTSIVVRDFLRRGARTNFRSDDNLFLEHFVHIVSGVRKLSNSDVESIDSATKRTLGSITEFSIAGTLSGGVPMNISLSLANTWSEDRYFVSLDDADTKISHDYDFKTRTYTDRIEHYHGTEDLIDTMIIPKADCGMRKCWKEFTELLEATEYQPSPSLLNSLHDVQVREAVMLSLSQNHSVPIVKLS